MGTVVRRLPAAILLAIALVALAACGGGGTLQGATTVGPRDNGRQTVGPIISGNATPLSDDYNGGIFLNGTPNPAPTIYVSGGVSNTAGPIDVQGAEQLEVTAVASPGTGEGATTLPTPGR